MPENRKSQEQASSPLRKSRLSVTEAGMRIVRRLIGRPPQRVTDLMTALAVTRTAVTEQLNELIAAGYVVQTQERCDGRGRPRYLFSATDRAMRDLFEGPQNIVCPAIWQSILRRAGSETMESIQRDVAKTLADYYNSRLFERTPKKRLKELISLLLQQGHVAEWTESETVVGIDILSCPFFAMLEDTGSICRIHLSALQMILGNEVSIRRIGHREKDARSCCVFQIERIDQNKEYPDRGKDI